MPEALLSPAAAWERLRRAATFRGLLPGQRLPFGLTARDPYPRFDNCALDGYALRAADLRAATVQAPLALRVAADQFAGSLRRARLRPGSCVQVATGAPLPPGADSVVPYELCARQGSRVCFSRPPRPGANVRRAGEDVARGQVLAAKGARLSPALMGLAAACGSLPPLLRVRALVSGDELATGGRPRPGQIHDANGPLLSALLAQAGLPGVESGRLPDRLGPALRRLRGALDCDLLLLAGGMSVGKRDVLKPALRRLGVQTLFWGLAQKPGKPLYFGRRGRTLVLGLPGNPAAVLTGFLAYARPLLAALSGRPAALPWRRARLAAALPAPGAKALWLKARLDPRGGVHVLGGQGSHQLRSLAQGNALLYLPASPRPLRAGTAVRVLSLGAGA